MDRIRPRAHDEEFSAYLLGVGSVHAVAEPPETDEKQAAIWLPDHKSGSRFGGWHRVPFQQPRLIGFRKP